MPGNQIVNPVSNPGESIVTYSGASISPINVVSVVPAALAVASVTGNIQPNVNLAPSTELSWPPRLSMFESIEGLNPQRFHDFEIRMALYQAEQAIQNALSTLSSAGTNIMGLARLGIESPSAAMFGGRRIFLDETAVPNLPIARLTQISNELSSLNVAESAIRSLPNPYIMPLTAANVNRFLNTLNTAQNAIGQTEKVLPTLYNFASESFWNGVNVTPQRALNLMAYGQLVSNMLNSLGTAQLSQLTGGQVGTMWLTRSLGGTHIFEGPTARILRLSNEINGSASSAVQALQSLNVNAFRNAFGSLNNHLAQFVSSLPSMVNELGPFRAAELALMANQFGVPTATRALGSINNALQLYINQATSAVNNTLGFVQALQQFLGTTSQWAQVNAQGSQVVVPPLGTAINIGPSRSSITKTTTTQVNVNIPAQTKQYASEMVQLGQVEAGLYNTMSNYIPQLNNVAIQLSQVISQLSNAWNNYISAVNSGAYGNALRALQGLMSNLGQTVNTINSFNNTFNEIAKSAIPYLQQLGNTLSQELGESLGSVTNNINTINNLLNSNNNLSALVTGSLLGSVNFFTGRVNNPQIVIGSNAVNLSNFVHGVRQLLINAQNYVNQLHNIISVLQNAQNNPAQALSYAISLLGGGTQQITNVASNLNSISNQLSLANKTLSEYINAGRTASEIGNIPAEVENNISNLGRFFADIGVDFRNFVNGVRNGNILIGIKDDLSQMGRLISNMGVNLLSMKTIDAIDTMVTNHNLLPLLAPLEGNRLLSQTSTLVNSVDAFISTARNMLAQLQTAINEGLSLAQVGGSHTWLSLYDASKTAAYDLIKGLLTGIGSEIYGIGEGLSTVPQLRNNAGDLLKSYGATLINMRPPETIVNAAANIITYSIPVVGPLSHLAAYWNEESDLEKAFDVVMAGLGAFMTFDAVDNFAAGFYRGLSDIVAQEARTSLNSVDVMNFLAENPSALARAFMAGLNSMFMGGAIENLPGLLTLLKNIGVSVGFSEAFTLGMAAAEHRLNSNDITALLLSGAMLGIMTYAMSAALGVTEEAALNLLSNPSFRGAFQEALTSVLTRFGNIIGISVDSANELAANATNTLFNVLSSNAFRSIFTRILEINNAGLINAGIALAATNGRLSGEQLRDVYLQGALFGALFFVGTQYLANAISMIKGTSAPLVYVYGGTPVDAPPAGFRGQLSFFDAMKAILLSDSGIPGDEAQRLATSDRVVLLRAPTSSFDTDDALNTATAEYGPNNFIYTVVKIAGDKNEALALPNLQSLAEGREITADQLSNEEILSIIKANTRPDMANVLVYEGSEGISNQPKFYYLTTKMDYIGGREALGDPIATFNSPDDLVKFLKSAQDPQDLMIITDGNTFRIYPRDFYLPQLDNGKTLVIVDGDTMDRFLKAFNYIKGGGNVNANTVNMLNRMPVYLLRDPTGKLIMTIGYDSLVKPISNAEITNLLFGEGVNPNDVDEVVAVHATTNLPSKPGEEFPTQQAMSTPYRMAAANNFYVAPGLYVRGAVIDLGDDGTISNVTNGPFWLRLGYYFYMGGRNENLVPGVPRGGNFIEIREMPFMNPEVGNLSYAEVLERYEQATNLGYTLENRPVITTPYENTLVLRGRVPLYPEYQAYISSAGEVPYYFIIPRNDPNFYNYLGTLLDPTGGNARYVEIVDNNGNVITSSNLNGPGDLGRFIIENADKIQPSYMIHVVDTSPENTLNFSANGTWHNIAVDNTMAAQLRELANGGSLALSMFNASGAPAFDWGVGLFNMKGGEAGITQAFIPDVRIGNAAVTLGVSFDKPLSPDDFRAFTQSLLSATSPDDVINAFKNYGATINMARVDNNAMFFNSLNGEALVNTLLSGGVDLLRGMANNIINLNDWANNDIAAYTLWIGQEARGAPTMLNPTETANLRFMNWANGGENYLNALLYNADSDSFYGFYMRPGANIELGEEVQPNSIYYSGAYGLVSELSNLGRGSPSPLGELANVFGRFGGELLQGLTGNYVPINVVIGTPNGAYTPRADVFLGQAEEAPQAVEASQEELQVETPIARPLAYIAPSAMGEQFFTGERISQPSFEPSRYILGETPMLRNLNNVAMAPLQNIGGINAQNIMEAVQANIMSPTALPLFSEALRQVQNRNVQPGQGAVSYTPQAMPPVQANIMSPQEAGPSTLQQLGQVQQTLGAQVALQPERQLGQIAQGYVVQPVQRLVQQQLGQTIAESQQTGVQTRQQQPQLGQIQQKVGGYVAQPQAIQRYVTQPYQQVAAPRYETQTVQQPTQPQAYQAQGYQGQPYGRQQAEQMQPAQQLGQVQLNQAQLYEVQPYQAQLSYQPMYQPMQQAIQQPAQQAQNQGQTQQQLLQVVQPQEQEQIPETLPSGLLYMFTQPMQPWWFRINKEPEEKAYLREVLAL